jgi:3-oxoacyl-[acyl-carrier-protein] synthase II
MDELLETQRGYGENGDAARIYVTGLGAVTPLGTSAPRTHERWAAGECGVIEGIGRCSDFEPAERLSRKQIRRFDRFAQFALYAAGEAADQAGWSNELPADRSRIGCVIGTGTGGMTTMLNMYEVFYGKAQHHVPPALPVMAMANGACAAVTLHYKLQGESFAVVSGCSSGAQSIGAAMRMLRIGILDAAIVGGSDTAANDWSVKAYGASGALSPAGIARPFDRDRDGYVLGEGAGVLILERADIAKRRGAKILAEAVGYGASTDAFHVTNPDPEGEGQATAIKNALIDSGLQAEQIDWVNAHGTGTRLNDPAETLALKKALGTRAYEIPISAPKSAFGHLIGAAGAVEAVATISALRARVAPPTLHLEHPDDELDLDYVPLRAKPLPPASEKQRLTAITNSFGLGGHNAILVFSSDA